MLDFILIIVIALAVTVFLCLATMIRPKKVKRKTIKLVLPFLRMAG